MIGNLRIFKRGRDYRWGVVRSDHVGDVFKKGDVVRGSAISYRNVESAIRAFEREAGCDVGDDVLVIELD